MLKQLCFLTILTSLLFACGYKGPLYLPQKKASSQPSTAVPPTKHEHPVIIQNESQVESRVLSNRKKESAVLE
jgi:predicted small lipoprotein YifL